MIRGSWFSRRTSSFDSVLCISCWDTYLLNNEAKQNCLPYLKIMYTAIRKILYLPKFFAFFSNKIDSLTLKVMTSDYPLCCPSFLPFLALKLIHLLWTPLLTPILPNFFAFFSPLVDSLSIFENHYKLIFCPIVLPFLVLNLIHIPCFHIVENNY